MKINSLQSKRRTFSTGAKGARPQNYDKNNPIMQSVLSQFLTAGLLPIGEDDEKLNLLEGAAAELAKKIKAAPLLAHRFALVGLDEKVPVSDPVHKLAEAAVFEKWQTITNKIGPSPVQVYRAVILRAIEISASERPHLGFAVALIAANLPGTTVQRKEQSAVSQMLTRYEETSMKEISDIWVNAISLSLPKLTAKAKRIHVSKDDLSLGLGRAAGPTDNQGRALTDPNPQWPNSGQPWSYEFVNRATDAIYSAIQSAAKGVAEDVQDAIRESVQSLAEGVNKMAIRDAKSELLWIRISLYSPSARQSFRDLDAPDLLLHAALDTSRVVGGKAPPSVAFFVRELVSALSHKKLRLVNTVAAIGPKLSALPEAESISKDMLGATGRRGLLDCAIRPNATESFEIQTGFKDAYEEGLPDLAVRLYRELQILKLLSS
jgi:hypothetical protein